MSHRVVVLVDRYPVRSETFVGSEVGALRRLGLDVRVEAVGPGDHAGEAPDAVWLHETRAQRLRAATRLAARHPLAVARDLLARRRWRREEPVPPLRMLAPAAVRAAAAPAVHLHVHFAAGAALSGLRIARILGIPWSVTAHAYEIYQRPANLPEKLRAASFVTSGCAYTVSDIRRISGGLPQGLVHEVIMGVDGEAFRRRIPYPGGRFVLAVGRLIPKKGFGDLIEAVALMDEPPDRVVIVGEGPLRDTLAAAIESRGCGAVVELAGERAHDEVRDLLERADVLCMPSVIAADGDRDSMPVVVKEALAMEIPVVASDEVGLPEVVRPEWGALVPPGNAAALAAALTAELARPPAERAARGAAGRAFVLEHCDVMTEARKLAKLIERAVVSADGADGGTNRHD